MRRGQQEQYEVKSTSDWEKGDDERLWWHGFRRWRWYVADPRFGGLGHRCADQVPALVGVAVAILVELTPANSTWGDDGSTTVADGFEAYAGWT